MRVEGNNTSTVRWAIGALGLLVLLGMAIRPTDAGADPAFYAGASADGQFVFFTTAEKLVPGDTDNKRDVYERLYDGTPGIESYVTREVSTGPAGGNDAYDVSFDGVSEGGLEVFFSTAEALVSSDKDLFRDIYMRDLGTGATTLVSRADSSCTAPNCGNGPFFASFDAVSGDGTRVVFSTEEALRDDDDDSVEDVYVRDLQGGGTTSLVSEADVSCSAPECGDRPFPAFFDGASTDAHTVAFSSAEALSGSDGDSGDDIYARDVVGGTTDLVSPAGACPAGLGQGECTPIFGGISGDGSHVFYETGERVAAGQDTDEGQDVYGWSGAAPALVSTGTGGGGDSNATYQGTSTDGAAVFFEIDESLAPADGDNAEDVYRRAGGTTALVSTGPTDSTPGLPADFEKASTTGGVAIFSTAQKLTEGDGDASRDVYSRDIGAGSTALVSQAGAGCAGSCGDGLPDASFAGASADGSVVFFETDEPLVGTDTDGSPDVYERSGGQTRLVSTGPNAKNGVSDPHLADVSGDGAHALITTEERLVTDDLDTEPDVYDRREGETLLVSTRNSDELVLGPAVPRLTGTNPASPNVTTEPGVRGEADVGTSIKIYATPDCSGAPVATGSAAQLEEMGIPVKVAAGSTTTFHATATFLNDTSACSTTSTFYQQVAETGGGGGGGGASGGGSGGGAGTGSKSGSTKGSKPGSRAGTNPVVPHTRITFAPASKTRLRRPTFQFVDSTGQEGTRFLCAVDRGRWSSCSSPTKLKKLGRGRHVFKVKGSNSGLWESIAVTRRFKVVSR
jgi:Tol biopolymer transport system component